ncbi:MAG: 50S ribosomal protein L3 [Planctomycetota bacterium]|nr:50S ribosomal protein L3 [Planctomycetota bacterium]
MQAAILGKKIGMTQVYDENGSLQPVTIVQAGPCSVMQVKTAETDGYNAVQLGFEDVKSHRATKPQIGHAAKAGVKPAKLVREIRLAEAADGVEAGQNITVEVFEGIAYVDVVGTTKGKGFAGGMKRHGFKGQPASHGTERKHRAPGSISSHSSNAGTGPKIKKGKRMAGHMGTQRCTARNHKLVGVNKADNVLLIKGSVPGANSGFLIIRQSKTAKINKASAG